MNIELKMQIDQNPNLKRYLKEHSYWYKYLNRDPRSLKAMEDAMKKEYKLTAEDRLEKLNQNISLVYSFLDILK